MVVGEADNGHGGGVFVVAHSACSLATAWMTTGGRGGAATATKGCRRRAVTASRSAFGSRRRRRHSA